MKQVLLGLTAIAGVLGLALIGQSWSLSSAALVGTRPPLPEGTPQALPVGQGFDFYVLALSWSPSYCADRAVASREPSQCSGARPYAFVVHGLWPQYETGYPRSCRTNQRGPDQALVREMLDIMPSTRLVAIQWERHGTCSGLSAPDYFQVIRAASQRIQIPIAYRNMSAWQRVSAGEVEQAFIAANPNMNTDGIAVERKDNLLREVRLCLTKALVPRACPEVDRGGETDRVRLALPPVRGGQN
jgi:ribonuclease T2